MNLNHVRQLMRSLYWSTWGREYQLATARTRSPWGNYSRSMMEAVASMEMASGGTSPSRRRAGTETSIPRNGVLRWRRRPWSLSGVSSIGIAFLGHEGLYRRRGGVGGARGLPPHRLARPGGHPRRLMVWAPCCPPPTLLRCSGSFRES